MPTRPYKLADGTPVSGVTTIISGVKLGSIEGLLAWANREGLAGRNHRDTRDAAADAGTCAHDMVECDIKGKEFDKAEYKPETILKAAGAFKAYKDWARQTKLKALHTEVPLVSERYKFGGTMDAILVDGKLSLGDWKTSNGVYPDMLLQLAGYALLWDENKVDEPIDGGFHLLRFSKPEHEDDPVHFVHHYWDQLNLAKEMFPLMVTLFEGHKRLRKML